ncbi:MAG TPA: hypothetical protein VJN02_06195 [Gammaproteobacteria bacterium]|nr:hypothetical protein [Gammaproteobacteria bacterium]
MSQSRLIPNKVTTEIEETLRKLEKETKVTTEIALKKFEKAIEDTSKQCTQEIIHQSFQGMQTQSNLKNFSFTGGSTATQSRIEPNPVLLKRFSKESDLLRLAQAQGGLSDDQNILFANKKKLPLLTTIRSQEQFNQLRDKNMYPKNKK